MKIKTAIAAAACSFVALGPLIAWGANKAPKAALSPDGGRVAFLADKTTVRVLDSEGNQLSETDLGSPPAELTFSPDGLKLAACSQSTGLVVIVEGESSPSRAESVGECSDLKWAPAGKRLYYVLTLSGTLSPNAPMNTHELKAWDAASGTSKTLHSAKLVQEPQAVPFLPAIPEKRTKSNTNAPIPVPGSAAPRHKQ